MGTVPCPEVHCTDQFPKPFRKQSQEDAGLPLRGSRQEQSGCLGRKRANPLKEKWIFETRFRSAFELFFAEDVLPDQRSD